MNETESPKEIEAGAAVDAERVANPAAGAHAGTGNRGAGVAGAPPVHPSGSRRQSVARWLGVGLAVAVIIIVALAANLRFQQQQLDDFGREASRRLDEAANYAQQARQQAQTAQSMAQGVERRLQDLESRARHTEAQQQALEHAWNELVVGEQNSILVDVEQSLLLAAEQLQLAGRVPSAIAALQLAEARLARSGRPAYRSAQQAIARDLKTLQSLPYDDFGQIATQIDRMLADVATFPLMTPGLGDSSGLDVPLKDAEPKSAAQGAAPANLGVDLTAAETGSAADRATNAAAGNASSATPTDVDGSEWWREAWENSAAWAARTRDLALSELRRFVEVRRIDSAEAFMLSAEQADILRANLSLRLIEARMALLARVNELWRSDLEAVAQAVRRYGEPRSPITRRLLRDVDELLALEPAPVLPNLNDSLRAVRALLVTIEAEPTVLMPGAESFDEGQDEGATSETAQESAAAHAVRPAGTADAAAGASTSDTSEAAPSDSSEASIPGMSQEGSAAPGSEAPNEEAGTERQSVEPVAPASSVTPAAEG